MLIQAAYNRQLPPPANRSPHADILRLTREGILANEDVSRSCRVAVVVRDAQFDRITPKSVSRTFIEYDSEFCLDMSCYVFAMFCQFLNVALMYS